MGHIARFGYALWAKVQDLVIRYGPQRKIWFSAMGCGAVFGCEL
jgi:hypothetical protein